MAKITPMMQQYFEIKENYKHCLLFFRLGDFYEMFFEDAVIASKELEITLTGKDWGQEERPALPSSDCLAKSMFKTRSNESKYLHPHNESAPSSRRSVPKKHISLP